MTEKINMQEISNLDKQLECLYKNKPLPEAEVKLLCDKACIIFFYILSIIY